MRPKTNLLQELTAALSDLVRDSKEGVYISGHEFNCMRRGICINGQYQISWDEAERLLSVLEGLEINNV